MKTTIAVLFAAVALTACGKMEEPKKPNFSFDNVERYSTSAYKSCAEKIDRSLPTDVQYNEQLACALRSRVVQ